MRELDSPNVGYIVKDCNPDPNIKVHQTLIIKNFWNDIITYFKDFHLHTLSWSYFSFIDMQMSGIYVTYE